MIIPRQMLPKRFDLWRIESAISASYRPTMPKFIVKKTDAQRAKIGKIAGWSKRARTLARSL